MDNINKWTILIVSIMGIFMANGCIDIQDKSSVTDIPIHTPDSTIPTVTDTTTEKDDKVKEDVKVDFKITENDIQLANRAVQEKNQEWGGMNIPGPGGGYISWGLSQNNALPEDIFIYTLIKYHNEKGIIVPSTIIEKGIDDLKAYGLSANKPGYVSWKESAIRKFWMDYSTATFGKTDIGGDDNIIKSFKWYLDTKNVELGNMKNKRLEGMIAADDARYRAMNSWKKFDGDVQNREEGAQMERDAYQAINGAEWAIQKAAEAIDSDK